MSNAGLSRREAVGFVPLVLPERSGGKGHRLSPAFSLSEAKGERLNSPELRGFIAQRPVE